jgi:hypothetical protein
MESTPNLWWFEHEKKVTLADPGESEQRSAHGAGEKGL